MRGGQEGRVLVVGTTADYVWLIDRRFPGRALFLTDARERAAAAEPTPGDRDEIVADLARPDEAVGLVQGHLRRWGLALDGVACFDDESLALSATIAGVYGLRHATPEAVALCRSKLACKKAWRNAGLPCPEAWLARGEREAEEVLARLGRPAVVKPLTGAGSELVFLCRDAGECREVAPTMLGGLAKRSGSRMYGGPDRSREPGPVFVVEEWIEGTELSVDFSVDGDHVDLLRTAGKIPASGETFGTTLAYVVPGDLPPALSRDALRDQVRAAAGAVGIRHGICMLDFIVRDGTAYMLEIAPRPGGDCLPPLLLRSGDLDILGVALDFAVSGRAAVPPPSRWKPMVGLRLFADRAGTLARVDLSALEGDPRVRECHLKHPPGHRVVLPPIDYDSRILGHVLFAPSRPSIIEEECAEILSRVVLEWEEEPAWAESTTSRERSARS